MQKGKENFRYTEKQWRQFEKLLQIISSRFISLPVSQIDNVIEITQRRVCETLGFDLSTLWQPSDNNHKGMELTHFHSPPDGPKGINNLDASVTFPWVYKQMLAGKILSYSNDQLPEEASIDKESRIFYGVKSSVTFPLMVEGGVLIGVISFDTIRDYRQFKDEEVSRLNLVAEIFTNALIRKRTEKQRNIERERLESAIDIAALGFYEMLEKHQIVFHDERLRELLGCPETECNNVRQFWLEHIHHEDQARVQTIIKKVLEQGVDRFELDYRYMHPERGLTWLHHLSRVHDRDKSGKATRVIGVMRDITDSKCAEQKLQQSESVLRTHKNDLQKLAGRLISVKEEELRRLSRELHDDLTQRLALAAINAGKLELEMSGRKQALSSEIGSIIRIKEQLIKMSEDVHRISRQLHPTILDDLGLLRAIESECEAVRIRDGLKVVFDTSEIPESFPDTIPLCLYRVIQEGLTNIIRHSGVKICYVDLHADHHYVYLNIRDMGRGFDPKEVRQKRGLGLVSMRERIQFVQGAFSIDSCLGEGTTIRVKIPLQKKGKI